jgi:hypothetical protein
VSKELKGLVERFEEVERLVLGNEDFDVDIREDLSMTDEALFELQDDVSAITERLDALDGKGEEDLDADETEVTLEERVAELETTVEFLLDKIRTFGDV